MCIPEFANPRFIRLAQLLLVRRGGRIVVVAFYEEPVELKSHVLITKNIRMIPRRGADFQRGFELMTTGEVPDQ